MTFRKAIEKEACGPIDVGAVVVKGRAYVVRHLEVWGTKLTRLLIRHSRFASGLTDDVPWMQREVDVFEGML